VSFDYDKLSAKESEHASWWTSYADLFMMLSIVFLLMYVASALRSGSAGFQQQMEYKKLSQKAEGLEQQIKVYNTLKDESLRKDASASEQEVYKKLMGKLTLLQEDARSEKVALRAQAKENEEKEEALNQYQQIVRNIINANILAKSQIHHRDELIVSKDATIEEKKAKIAEMEQIVAQDEAQISTINTQLDKKIKALHSEQHAARITKQQMEKKIASLRQDSESRIQTLEEKKRVISQQLGEVRGTLEHTEEKLVQATGTIQKQVQENSALSAKLEADRGRYIAEMNSLKAAHDARIAAERKAFMAGLHKQRLSAAARAKKMAKFAADAERKAGELEGKLAGLRGKVEETEGKLKGTEAALGGAEQKLAGTQQALHGTQQKLAGAEAEKARALAAYEETQGKLKGTQAALGGAQQRLAGTQQQLAGAEADKVRALASVEDLKGDLAKTRAIANARKQLAKQISDQFAKSGLKGAVDDRTGEVTLDFGGEYFETGSTSLKPKMRVTLDKFIPIYARSLFNDPKVADKIASVEVVGFASSTYQGRYVNPKSIRDEDKKAIEYNLKLSFGRANSIFSHVLNQGQLTKAEREKLLPLMKVVGRGYLPDGKSASDLPDGMTEKEFCAKYNCQKAQKVVVKFNMKD
jgi:outer membrane protein OmpA-like peptidoglycan-associated protein